MVNKFLYPRGGAETYMLEIGAYLQSQGHQVSYFGMRDERNTVGNSLGLETAAMDFRSRGPGRILYPLRVLYSLEARRKIQRLIRAFSPDVIHLNNIYYHLTPSIIDGAAELGVPMVETVHDFHLVCPNHMMLDPEDMTPCRRCLDGSVWSCAGRRCIHGSRAKSVLGSLEAALCRRRRSYDQVSRLICPSRFMEEILLEVPRFRGKTVMMHNFIRPEAGPPAEKGDYALYFGRLSEEKGIDRLLAACRLVPEIPVVVAGRGPLEELVRREAPANVRYVGFQEGEALRDLVDADDIIAKADAYIREHFRENINREDVAAVACITPNYLSKQFRIKKGMNLREYINKIRIDEAKRLLLSTNLPVSEIAGMTGYDNISYFSTVFRKHVGMSPVDWRLEKGGADREA